MRFRESESERQGARAHTRDALTVEEPGDVRGGRPLGLARNRRVFPVECGHVSRRVDQHGRRGCNGRDVSYSVFESDTDFLAARLARAGCYSGAESPYLTVHSYVVLNRATYSSFTNR